MTDLPSLPPTLAIRVQDSTTRELIRTYARAARRLALEEAARICEREEEQSGMAGNEFAACAAAIRAAASSEAALTDRELLEKAAKAAGVVYFLWNGEMMLNTEHYGCKTMTPWNPLTDDGDALRLAVKLQMLGWTVLCAAQPNGMEAVRRAIVSAAALTTPSCATEEQM